MLGQEAWPAVRVFTGPWEAVGYVMSWPACPALWTGLRKRVGGPDFFFFLFFFTLTGGRSPRGEVVSS